MEQLKWEQIPHDNSGYLTRAKVFGGWLVKITEDVNEFQGEMSHLNMHSGYQWRSSITFVPDVNEEWK